MRFSHLCFFFLLLVVSVMTLITGPTPWNLLWKGALERFHGTSTLWNPLLDERLPRLIVVLSTGSALAVSGAVMQALFQNPLASPGILGITSGGSLLMMVVFIAGWHLVFPSAIPIAAFLGCLVTLILVYTLARKRGYVEMNTLILTGIAVTTLLISIQSAILYALRDHWQLIQSLTELEAGSTIDRSWKHVHMQLPLTLIGLGGCYYYRQAINVLTLGEDEALNLGVDVKTVRWRLFLCVALLTGGALAATGVITFFGLVLPHVLRRLMGPDNSRLIPASILWGGLTLASLDLMIRLGKIHTFSIGNVSAVLGGMFFLLLLFKRQQMEPVRC